MLLLKCPARSEVARWWALGLTSLILLVAEASRGMVVATLYAYILSVSFHVHRVARAPVARGTAGADTCNV
jgi:hypothetical protein